MGFFYKKIRGVILSKIKDKILNNCSKEQLIFILKKYERALYFISEVCVEESKQHISSEKSVGEIRKQLRVLNEISYSDMQNNLDLLMDKIDIKEYRKRLGLDE